MVHAVPWKPQCAVLLSLGLTAEVLSLPCLERYGKIPLCQGPRLPWSHFKQTDVEVRMPLEPHSRRCNKKLDSMFAQFLAQCEAWVMSTVTDVTNVKQGRGRILEVGVVKLDHLKAPAAVWKDKAVGFWSLLCRWVSDFCRKRAQHKRADSSMAFPRNLRGRRARWVSVGREGSLLFLKLVCVSILASPERSKAFSFLALQYVLLRLNDCAQFVSEKAIEQLQAHVHEAQLVSLAEARNKAKQWAEEAVKRPARTPQPTPFETTTPR